MLFFENRKDFGGIILDYKGIKCPVCEKPFTENDDIVVCPTCGAPYHRACYMEKGECIFTDLHEAGKDWAPPPPPSAPDISSEIKDKECPNCGTLNAHSALFCSICNASLTGTPETHRNSAYSTPPAGSGPNRAPGQGAYPPPPPMSGAYHGFGGMPIAFDPMGGANPTEPIAENVTYGDVSKLVQQNSGYYMAVFKNTNTYGRSKFNFSAFLFSGGWFLYRKQYKPGIILTAIMFLLLIGSSLVSYLIVNPIMIDALDTVGISYNDATYLQLIDALTQYFSANPAQYLLFCLPLLIYALMLGIMIFSGIRGNRMYMKHCVRTVQEIKRTSQNESDAAAAYSARGGVNTAAAFCLLGCYLITQWIPLFFI